jgi:hypothetical protein
MSHVFPDAGGVSRLSLSSKLSAPAQSSQTNGHLRNYGASAHNFHGVGGFRLGIMGSALLRSEFESANEIWISKSESLTTAVGADHGEFSL